MTASFLHVSAASSKAPLDACLADLRQGRYGSLGVVVDVSGHVYGKPGTLIYVDPEGQRSGWISAGCLEGEVITAAMEVLADGQGRLLNLDNLDLSDVMFSGAGAGCRGQQWVLLLPLARLAGLEQVLAAFRDQRMPLRMQANRAGQLDFEAGTIQLRQEISLVSLGREATAGDAANWALEWAPLPRVLLMGCGPESEHLLPLLGQLGWRLDIVESRRIWASLAQQAEQHLLAAPASITPGDYDAVVIMGHHFTQDGAALAALAQWQVLPRYIGLLGPAARQKELLADLPAEVGRRLQGVVESPAGAPLCGQGPAAIALSLAVRLQAIAASARP